MSNNKICDYNCQREKNIKELKRLYNAELKNYYNVYQKYMNYRFSKNRSTRKQAEYQFKPKVIRSNQRLNEILTQLKENILESNNKILQQNEIINRKTIEIHNQNKVLSKLDKDLASKKLSIITKNRQLETGKGKNFYKRNIMIFLIILNVIIIGAIYYLIKSNGAQVPASN